MHPIEQRRQPVYPAVDRHKNESDPEVVAYQRGFVLVQEREDFTPTWFLAMVFGDFPALRFLHGKGHEQGWNKTSQTDDDEHGLPAWYLPNNRHVHTLHCKGNEQTAEDIYEAGAEGCRHGVNPERFGPVAWFEVITNQRSRAGVQCGFPNAHADAHAEQAAEAAHEAAASRKEAPHSRARRQYPLAAEAVCRPADGNDKEGIKHCEGEALNLAHLRVCEA